jgi:glucosylceramidase
MRKLYFNAYAQYFVRFLQSYAVDDVKIDAVTIQNEVDTDQDGHRRCRARNTKRIL